MPVRAVTVRRTVGPAPLAVPARLRHDYGDGRPSATGADLEATR